MSDKPWIVIPRWDEFQHPDATRSQVPPWIKTYTRLLNNPDYLDLTPGARALLHDLWLLYAASRQEVRNSTARISRQIGRKITQRQLEALNHAGFIEFSASKPASTVASLEKRREEPPISPKHRTSKTPVDNSYRASANVQPKNPAAAIEAMIRNGVITDPVDLEAELQGYRLNSDTAERLRELL